MKKNKRKSWCLWCPECDSPYVTLLSGSASVLMIEVFRDYFCGECGHAFTTVERLS